MTGGDHDVESEQRRSLLALVLDRVQRQLPVSDLLESARVNDLMLPVACAGSSIDWIIDWIAVNGDRVDATATVGESQFRIVFGSTSGTRLDWLDVFRRRGRQPLEGFCGGDYHGNQAPGRCIDVGLGQQDLRRVLDVISPEAVASEVGEMPQEVLRGLADLIPSAGVSFAVWDENTREVLTCHRVCFTDDPGWDDGMAELFWGGYDECKAVSGLAGLGEAGQVNVWQDFYSHRQFAGTPMYELYRRQGTYHRMMIRLHPRRGLERRVQITRERGDSGFTERDKMLMRLLRPHLSAIRDRIESDRDGAARLTARQRELLRLVADGLTNRQIGRELGLSEGTVRKHLENVYARLGVQNRVQAIAQVAPH